MRKMPVLVIASLFLAAAAVAQVPTCLVCVADPDVPTNLVAKPHSGPDAAESVDEHTALTASLTGLGFTHQTANDPTTTTCNLYVTYPGSNYLGSAALATWVQAGHGVVQLSDWGPGFQANLWLEVASGSAQTVTIVDAAHPITAGVPASWSTFGFWNNDPTVTQDYVGWVTDADPNLAQISGNDRGLSARAEGSGRVVYVGWGVYGPAATANDLTILANAITWAGQCAVPVGLQTFAAE
jgi:hypothetical protein